MRGLDYSTDHCTSAQVSEFHPSNSNTSTLNNRNGKKRRVVLKVQYKDKEGLF